MRLNISHTTIYRYHEPAFESQSELRLRPLDDDRQTCLSFRIETSPSVPVYSFVDYFGNTVHSVSIAHAHRWLRIHSEAIVRTEDESQDPTYLDSGLNLSELRQQRSVLGILDRLTEFLMPSRYVPDSPEVHQAALDAIGDAEINVVEAIHRLLAYIRGEITYEPGSTHVESDTLQVLQGRRGVCQDFAHLMIGLARSLGIPARYVSGYVHTGDGGELASHAWAELFIPSHGWIELDGTSMTPVDGRYARIARGRDYHDAAPVRGTIRGGGRQELAVSVSMQHTSPLTLQRQARQFQDEQQQQQQ